MSTPPRSRRAPQSWAVQDQLRGVRLIGLGRVVPVGGERGDDFCRKAIGGNEIQQLRQERTDAGHGDLERGVVDVHVHQWNLRAWRQIEADGSADTTGSKR